MEVSAIAAFIAGLVSFLSPCVLPLVPGYISMLSGIGVEQLRQGEQPRGSLLGSSVAFVAGFSVVFVTFGASASGVGRLIGALLVAGALTVRLNPGLLGRALGPVQLVSVSLIFLAGPFLTRWLNRDAHFRNLGGQPGLTSGFLMGFAFAFGWTPCIGPILAGVLAIAATSETIGRGVFLLAVYSAGLAIPFLLTALGISRFLRFYQSFRQYLHAVEVSSGVLLLLVGGLVFVNRLAWLSGKLSFLNRFAW